MLEKQLPKRAQNFTPAFKGGTVSLIAASAFLTGHLQAQDGSSGMTQGLPGVSPARQAELMHIRAQAQAAKPEAEAAAMQRSAEKALDQKANRRLLEEARETKRLKEQAARSLEFERAANAFKKVSRNDIEAYTSSTGGRVKVQQDVPGEFYAALPLEEEEEKKGFWRPFGGGDKEKAPKKEGGSWIPFFGKNKDKEDEYVESPSPSPAAPSPIPPYRPQPAPQPTESAPIIPPGDPQPIPGNVVDTGNEKDGMFKNMGNFFKRDKDLVDSPEVAATTAPLPEEEEPGFFKKMGSGLSFGKKEEVNPYIDGGTSSIANTTADPAPAPSMSLFGPQTGSGYVAPPPAPATGTPATPAAPVTGAPAPTMAAAEAPPLVEEKKGMFSGIKNFASKLIPGNKNNEMAGGSGAIDPSLFPQSGDSSQLMADTSGVPREKKKLKMPSLPDNLIPSAPVKPPEAPKPPMPKKDRSPVHSGGSDLYVVEAGGTQFLRFGDSQMGSDTLSLQPGTVVRMTKVGDEWSSVQLSDGSTGIIRNKALRPASSGDAAPGTFPGAARSSAPIASASGGAASTSGTARITRPVSATGAGTEKTPGTIGPPVSIPESRLTSGGTNSGLTP